MRVVGCQGYKGVFFLRWWAGLYCTVYYVHTSIVAVIVIGGGVRCPQVASLLWTDYLYTYLGRYKQIERDYTVPRL